MSTPIDPTPAAGAAAEPVTPEVLDEDRRGIVGRAAARVDELVRPIARPLALAGAGLLALGSLAPWAQFRVVDPVSGEAYPGKQSLGTIPNGLSPLESGHRLYTLVLAVGVLALLLRGGKGRFGAVRAAATGAFVITWFNLFWPGYQDIPGGLAGQGGGLGAIAWGGWLAAVGSLVLLVAVRTLPPVRPAIRPRVLPFWADALLLVGSFALLLGGVVISLAIEEALLFLSFFGFVMSAAAVASRLGAGHVINAAADRRKWFALAGLALTAIVFPFTQGGESYWIRVMASVLVFAAVVLGLNIVIGLAGLLDLGYVAFFGIGAYVGALFSGAAASAIGITLPFPVVLVMGAVIAGTFGVLLGAPTLRLRGDYLAIVTLGFGEIFTKVVNNWDGLTNGPNGIPGIPQLNLLGQNFGDGFTIFGQQLPSFATYYFLELVVLAVFMVIFANLNHSRIGRAWVAIREDEVVAQAMGINTTRFKLMAFAIGATLAGAAGVVNAHLSTQVSPDSYVFNISILLVAAVVLGGMGTIAGSVLGSALLIVLPEKLRFFSDYRILIFGLALVLFMRFRPEGMIPSRRRRQEFHESEEPEENVVVHAGGV